MKLLRFLWRITLTGFVLVLLAFGAFRYELSNAENTKSQIAEGPAQRAFSSESLKQDIVTYDGFGHHRTGEAGDLATTEWLATRLSALGYRVTRQAFTIPTYIVDDARLLVSDTQVNIFPQFPVTFTSATGVAGPVYSVETPPENWADKIAYVEIPASTRNSSLEQPELFAAIDSAAQSGAIAVIVMTHAKCGTYQAYNAPVSLPEWPVPVVLVGDQDADVLKSAIDNETPVSLSVTGSAKPLEAFNLIADAGPEEQQPIVVSTPQSGWFHATAERGSGIAAFLALAQWAADQKDQRFMFVTNSGHERVNFGAHKFMKHFAPTPENTKYWLHIGANVGAKVHGSEAVSTSRFMMTNWGEIWKSWALFKGQPNYNYALPLEFGLAAGELRDYHDAGYRPLAGVFGAGDYHHCANDQRNNVSVQATREATLSFAALLQGAMQ